MAGAQIDKILNIYRALALNPTMTSARIASIARNGVTVQSVFTQRNLERRTKQKFTQDFSLDADLNLLVESFPVDVSNEVANAATENEKIKAILRNVAQDGITKQYIEIWDRQHLIKSYDLSVFDAHGEIYTDPEFSSFHWSPDNKKVMYIAEKKLPKTEPFYKQKSKDKKKGTEEEEVIRGAENYYKPHWGEELVGKHQSVIVVLNVEEDTIKANPFIPEEYFPGQVLWTPNGEYIVGVAWKREPRYLGLYACTNRASWIFILKDTEFRKLSPDGCGVRSPRFSPDGQLLIWLERELGGPHHNCHRLMCAKWQTDEKNEVLVDIVKTKQVIEGGKIFYGLYHRNLPRRCWSNDSQYIFLSTPQKNDVRSYIIHAPTKKITEVDNPDGTSLNILEVRKNRIVFARTSLLLPPQLTVGRFDPSEGEIGNLKLLNVTNPITLPGTENLMIEHTEYEYDKIDSKVKEMNYTYFGPKGGEDKSVPLIVMPHGGPNSNFANIFVMDYAICAILGFGLLQINFRGSTGMGSDNIEFLQGRIGETDVMDCMTLINHALKKYPWLNPDKIGLRGGSHGGFLCAHLSGQHPTMFKTVILLNPVIDIPAMYSSTDIPDWCAAQTGVPFMETLPLATLETKYAEIFLKMFNHSPLIHADKVKAPTLICLGSKDLRVPPYQGKLWYHRLVANKVKTKMLWYPDGHALNSDAVEMDCVINTANWLLRHLTDQPVEEVPEVAAKKEEAPVAAPEEPAPPPSK